MSIKDDAKGKCITCSNCNQQSTGSLRCTKYREYVKIDDPKISCYSYSEAVYRSDEDIKNMIKLYGKYFILTRINNIYNENGKNLNNNCFNMFKLIYDQILPQTIEGQKLAENYTKIGPIIADLIEKEYHNPQTQKRLLEDLENIFEKIINVATSLALDKHFDSAVFCYKSLIYAFEKRYNIKSISENKTVSNLNTKYLKRV